MQQDRRNIPSHVPPELVVDVDYFDLPGANDDPQCAWRALKSGGPLSWSPFNGGHWIANTADAVFRFYRDVEHLSAKELMIPRIDFDDPQIPNQSDPPEHSEYRSNIMPIFTPSRIRAMSDDVRRLCVELIDEIANRGECEFVQDFALKFPLGIFLRMMGLPAEDRMYLRELVETFSDSPDVAAKAAAAEKLRAYIDRALEERIEQPREDTITMVTRFRFKDRPYTRREMRGTVRLLMSAGLDTVTGMLSFIARHLALHPEHGDYIRDRLGSDDDMHQIVQELLRRYAIVSSSRLVVKDYTYEGVTMKTGDMVIMPSAFFNQDSKQDNPDSVDFERPSKRHITFGSGPHVCAGALLAREEIRIFLEEWLTRIPQTKLDPSRPPKLKALSLNGVQELHLKWDRAVSKAA